MADESYKAPGFYETQLDLYLKRERKENGLIGFHVSAVPVLI